MSKEKTKGEIRPFVQGPAFYVRRGDAHFEDGDILEALGLYMRATLQEPGTEKAWLRLAETYSEMGCYQLSNRALLGMTWRCKSLPDSFFYRLGCNFVALQSYELALECFRRHTRELEFVGELPESDEILQLLETLELAGPEDVFSDSDASENGARIIAHHGESMLRNGDPEGAISLLTHARELAPYLPEVETTLALAHWTLQHYDTARELCESAISNDQEDVRAYCLLATIADNTGDDMLLVKCIDALSRIDYSLVSDAFQAALTLGELEEHERAEPLIKRCLFEDPYDINMLHAYAVNSYNLQDGQTAADMWERMHKIIPDDPIADFYCSLGREAKTKNQLVKDLPYTFDLPEVEIIQRRWVINGLMKRQNEDKNVSESEMQQIRNALTWAIEYGDNSMQRSSVLLIPKWMPERSEELLRDYLLREDVSESIKDSAMMHLHQMDLDGPYIAMLNNSIMEVSYWDLSAWEQFPNGYGETIQLLLDNCAERHEHEVARCGIKIWRYYVESYPGRLPAIRKPENYAAALEYIVKQMTGLHCTQKEVAGLYSAVVSGVARSIDNIIRVLPELLDDDDDEDVHL